MSYRRARVPLPTSLGVLDLDAKDAHRITVSTRLRPLAAAGESVEVRMCFLIDETAGEYRLATSSGPVVWPAGEPGRRCGDRAALAVMAAVEAALRDFLAADPAFGAFAKAERLREKADELDGQIVITRARLDMQMDQRRRLSSESAALRRSIMAVVPGGLVLPA